MDYQLVLKLYNHKRGKPFLAVVFPQENYEELFKKDVGKTCYFDYFTNCLKIAGHDNSRLLLLSKLDNDEDERDQMVKGGNFWLKNEKNYVEI